MSKKRKLLKKILEGSNNVSFDELVTLVEGFGSTLSRINGSHHIFHHPDIPDLVNLQNRKGSRTLSNSSQEVLELLVESAFPSGGEASAEGEPLPEPQTFGKTLQTV
ncbi:type II toxin-antitoxin system HicA family toxin [Leptolyngbya sp. DQ-M1]|uniref:type II toxin-antitoxin system HicA family toxin n=1 Tax=Leptolyngbya sp. DQ-M1 TaxID=2933920 RepID=UPI003298AC9B